MLARFAGRGIEFVPDHRVAALDPATVEACSTTAPRPPDSLSTPGTSDRHVHAAVGGDGRGEGRVRRQPARMLVGCLTGHVSPGGVLRHHADRPCSSSYPNGRSRCDAPGFASRNNARRPKGHTATHTPHTPPSSGKWSRYASHASSS